jgi:alginate O-acetyltransferase complex protein AlgI
VHDDFHQPKVSTDMFAAGAARFLFGVCKKVLIADSVGAIATAAFAVSPDQQTFAIAWLGAIAFSIQIYFDFSAYSDMAIGLAQMFGIRFLENFNHPYAASTITEFWRRWHISLSTWFRDYLYIPLGGNRKGVRRTYINLSIVFLATGIWHGAAWTFVLWGAWHGAFLIFERVVWGNGAHAIRSERLRLFYLFPAVIFSWVLFQAHDLAQFGGMAWAMLKPLGHNAFAISGGLVAALSPQNILALGVSTALVLMQDRFLPLGPTLGRVGANSRFRAFRLIFIAAAALVSLIFVIPQDFSPFLYFRF